MYNLKNKVQLIGHLGAAPEVRNLDANRKVATVSIATNESYTNAKGEKVENTEWHRIVMWDKTAELAEKLLQKGSEVLIEGKLTHRQYADKDGVVKYITEVVANSFLLLGQPARTSDSPAVNVVREDETEMPF